MFYCFRFGQIYCTLTWRLNVSSRFRSLTGRFNDTILSLIWIRFVISNLWINVILINRQRICPAIRRKYLPYTYEEICSTYFCVDRILKEIFFSNYFFICFLNQDSLILYNIFYRKGKINTIQRDEVRDLYKVFQLHLRQTVINVNMLQSEIIWLHKGKCFQNIFFPFVH